MELQVPTNRQELYARLSEPFPVESLGWKPQATSGSRALAVAYIDARDVDDRLNQVLGLGNWQTSIRETKEGVICTLSIRIDGEWVHFEDVGGFSEQKDPGDRLKAACSDALKRAAVHLGIGRYLYNLPSEWCDYDSKKNRFADNPPFKLPAWALPAGARKAPKPAPATATPAAVPLYAHDYAELQALILKAGKEEAKVLEWVNKGRDKPLDSLRQLDRVKYEQLVQTLNGMIAEKPKAQAG